MVTGFPLSSELDRLVDRAIEEDVGDSDITTENLIDEQIGGQGVIVAKEAGVIAGLPMVALVFRRIGSGIELEIEKEDGCRVGKKDIIARVAGPMAGILKGERVALNFLQRLSGIATVTSLYVSAVKGLPCRILDTRKTTPGLRNLEKYAVRVGGGFNHRLNLGDGVLVKDNHLASAAALGLSIQEAIQRLKANVPSTLKIEVEVVSLEQAVDALEGGADSLLLDNMAPEVMRGVVGLVNGTIPLEASGGINLSNIRAVADTGVDLISIGALTHSVKALDISLLLDSPT